MIELAPDFTSDAPSDWKPSGKFDGVIFLGQTINSNGQILRPSRMRDAMRVLAPPEVMVRIARALAMSGDANLVSGLCKPQFEDFLQVLDGDWASKIRAACYEKQQPGLVFLRWLREIGEHDPAVNPLQEPHRNLWKCVGQAAEGVWALSYG